VSLLRTVPNRPADPDIPFLLQVNFEEYAKLLAEIPGEIGEQTVRTLSETAADALCRLER
jgi:hypothetical protein